METKPTTPAAPAQSFAGFGAGAGAPPSPWGAPARPAGAPASPFGNTGMQQKMPPAAAPKPSGATGSFLDDWLSKRKSPVSPMVPPKPAYQPKPNNSSPGMNPFPAPAASNPPVPMPNSSPAPTSPSTFTAPAHSTPPSGDQSTGEPVNNPNDPSHGHLTPGDTIYIDREGNLKQGD